MICEKCRQDFSDVIYEQNKTYKGIDYHHSPPTFTFTKDKLKWEGDLIPLCRNCHVEIHKEIKRIIFENTTLLKFNNSEEWTWNFLLPANRSKVRFDILQFTRKWLKGDKEDDTK